MIRFRQHTTLGRSSSSPSHMIVLSTFCQARIALRFFFGQSGSKSPHDGRVVALSDAATFLFHLSNLRVND
jgi:hypothetical protein